jgi:hypothetical protein
VPAATACSCDATHFARPVGSGVGDDLAVGVGERVATASDRVGVVEGGGVEMRLVGVPQDTSITARSQRTIVRR